MRGQLVALRQQAIVRISKKMLGALPPCPRETVDVSRGVKKQIVAPEEEIVEVPAFIKRYGRTPQGMGYEAKSHDLEGGGVMSGVLMAKGKAGVWGVKTIHENSVLHTTRVEDDTEVLALDQAAAGLRSAPSRADPRVWNNGWCSHTLRLLGGRFFAPG